MDRQNKADRGYVKVQVMPKKTVPVLTPQAPLATQAVPSQPQQAQTVPPQQASQITQPQPQQMPQPQAQQPQAPQPAPAEHIPQQPLRHTELIKDMQNTAGYDVNSAVDYISKVSRAFDSTVNTRESATLNPQPADDTGVTAGSNSMLIISDDVPFQYREAYHSLRTNIKFLSANRDCKVIIITSSIPAEGKSNVSINLALALSATGSSTGLVDADFRKPMLHNYLGIPEGEKTGLTGVLRGSDDIKNCLYRFVSRDNLYVVPCGEIPPNPTEILGSSRMGSFIEAMAKHFDYVIIDTPPVSVVTDAAVLSRFADGVLLVVRQKLVTFDQARRAKRHLENVNATILGAVLNDFDTKHLDRESGYYYSDYYSI